MAVEPVTLVEIDTGACGRAFGVAPCVAALSAAVPCKCFNTFATCANKPNYLATVKTLRFAESLAGLPKSGAVIFPALRKVSEYAASVNIAGADDSAGPLGRRATVTVELQDFAYHDRGIDPYQDQRVSGAAQFGGVGYDPSARGTFFARLKSRWPYYSGRALRVITGDLVGGVLAIEQTRNYIITNWRGPDASGRVIIEARDVLDLAGNDRAVAPKQSTGVLAAAVTVSATALTLSPAGIGSAEYPVAGRACIGSEIVSYTRAGDAITLTARGLAGSIAAGHALGDTFQQVLRFSGARIDDAVYTLLRDFANVPDSYLPKAAQWAGEVTRWLSQIRLETHICQPTGVAQLIGELCVLGFSIYPNAAGNQLMIRANRPPDGDPVYPLSDERNLKSIDIDDNSDKRLTEIIFYSVQIDPTKSVTDASNYRRGIGTYDLEAKDARAYGDARARKIFCRWFNVGADNEIGILSKRLLARFNSAPVKYRVKIDAKDSGIGLADIVTLQSDAVQDVTGARVDRAAQVVARAETVAGHEIELTLQAYDFLGRYGFVTENARPVFGASSAAQKARGAYAVGAGLVFSDGSLPYRAI